MPTKLCVGLGLSTFLRLLKRAQNMCKFQTAKTNECLWATAAWHAPKELKGLFRSNYRDHMDYIRSLRVLTGTRLLARSPYTGVKVLKYKNGKRTEKKEQKNCPPPPRFWIRSAKPENSKGLQRTENFKLQNLATIFLHVPYGTRAMKHPLRHALGWDVRLLETCLSMTRQAFETRTLSLWHAECLEAKMVNNHPESLFSKVVCCVALEA